MTSDRTRVLERLYGGFRERYLRYDELERQALAWASDFPDLARVERIGRSNEGRDLLLLTIGREPGRERPAIWVDGNMHASELAGSSVALSIAEDAIRLHLTDDVRELPRHVVAMLRDDVLFYVLPRMSPDGAEHVLTTGAYVRSNPRDERLGRTHAFWRACDVDGDGAARLMRIVDPSGDFVASREDPDVLLPRDIDDEGPFYCVYPEGLVENFDGVSVPGAEDFLADNATDMNRNFPYQWAPEPHQRGAGEFATSEPESRAVTEFATRHPNIFAWLNLHTFGGCWIRPAGDMTDKRMNQRDLAIYEAIERWTDAFTGYPMVSGYEEFTYEPDKPLAGDLEAFAYAQRGAVAIVCELWDFWKQSGVEVRRPFVKNYDRRSVAELHAMARWDREHNKKRVVTPWRAFDHPQLGAVEIGGYDPRFGVWNPPVERLAEICDQQARVIFRMAAMAPRLRFERVRVTPLEGELFRVSTSIANHGFLSTFVLDSARSLPFCDPVRVELVTGDGIAIVGGEARQDLGHLEGWGGCDRPQTPSFARTRHVAGRRAASWIVRGRGDVTLRAGCARLGQVEARVEVG